nr:phosphopantetheine-binding protein [Streptomyces sp. XY58]
MEIFDAALTSPEPLLAAADLDLPTLRSPDRSAPALLRTLVRAPRRRAAAAAGSSGAGGGSWAERTAALPAADRLRTVGELVRTTVAAVLGLAGPESVDEDTAFKTLGMDSLTGLELRRRVVAVTGITLPATAVFDHPTPTALAEFLAGELAGPAGEAVAVRTGQQIAVRGPSGHEDPIVIVGMACRYPGDTRSPEDLWRLVADGTDAISTGTPTARGIRTPATAVSSTTRTGSTPSSSGSARARPPRWTLSSACCWRPAGRRWRARASRPPPCAAPGPVSSAVRCTASTPPTCATLRRPWRPTVRPATRSAWRPAGSRTRWASRVRPSPSTRPVPPPSSPCTWPPRPCARASAAWRSRAA